MSLDTDDISERGIGDGEDAGREGAVTSDQDVMPRSSPSLAVMPVSIVRFSTREL